MKRVLEGKEFTGRIFIMSVGKAAWQMAKCAAEALHQPYAAGIVVTQYGHVQGEILGFTGYEAGHPIPDEKYVLTQDCLKGQGARFLEVDWVPLSSGTMNTSIDPDYKSAYNYEGKSNFLESQA